MVYVGFWLRVVAAIIDSIILGMAGGLLSMLGIGDATEGLVGIALFLAYESYFLSSDKMATPGKMVIGAVVVKPDGRRLTLANALGRTLSKYVSAFILFIGYIVVAFTDKKQGLHDMMASTVVVKRDTLAVAAEASAAGLSQSTVKQDVQSQ